MAKNRRFPCENEACNDVSDFLRIVRELRPLWRKLGLPTQNSKKKPLGEEKELWFRGQSDVEFGLVAKYWRDEYKRANEAEMRLEFMSVGHPLAPGGNSGDHWYWYFLMQHYGCPTRLLDWTTNPLVALYFAVRKCKEHDAAVWVLDPWRWNRAHVKNLYGPAIPGWKETEPYLLELEDAFDSEVAEKQTNKKWPIAIEPSHIDRRIAAQGSKFVLFGKCKNMLDSPAINRKQKDRGKHAIVDRIVIPRGRAESILSELNSLGVNQRSLFPDLEGLGQHIAWEWEFPSGTEAIRTASSPRRRFPEESGAKSPTGVGKAFPRTSAIK
jgi:hypothetical protein